MKGTLKIKFDEENLPDWVQNLKIMMDKATAKPQVDHPPSVPTHYGTELQSLYVRVIRTARNLTGAGLRETKAAIDAIGGGLLLKRNILASIAQISLFDLRKIKEKIIQGKGPEAEEVLNSWTDHKFQNNEIKEIIRLIEL